MLYEFLYGQKFNIRYFKMFRVNVYVYLNRVQMKYLKFSDGKNKLIFVRFTDGVKVYKFVRFFDKINYIFM